MLNKYTQNTNSNMSSSTTNNNKTTATNPKTTTTPYNMLNINKTQHKITTSAEAQACVATSSGHKAFNTNYNTTVPTNKSIYPPAHIKTNKIYYNTVTNNDIVHNKHSHCPLQYPHNINHNNNNKLTQYQYNTYALEDITTTDDSVSIQDSVSSVYDDNYTDEQQSTIKNPHPFPVSYIVLQFLTLYPVLYENTAKYIIHLFSTIRYTEGLEYADLLYE